MTTTKFTEEQRATAMEQLIYDGDLIIMPIEEFMTAYEPYEISSMVRLSNLKLDCDYIRVGDYYANTHEADTVDDLVSDDEIEEALEELQ